MTRAEARKLLEEMTTGFSLLRHARTVQLVMEAMAIHFEEDVEKFSITGLLHDADYEAYPDKHPGVIVEKLKEMGEEEIAHAIAGHYTKWNVPRISMLDKCIIAADEITGFIVASALIRPTRLEGLTVKSVMKKFNTATFAASVDREECRNGATLIGWELRELIAFIIPVLQENAEELNLMPQ
jgi:predicted hydrolase (HD superfamily)